MPDAQRTLVLRRPTVTEDQRASWVAAEPVATAGGLELTVADR